MEDERSDKKFREKGELHEQDVEDKLDRMFNMLREIKDSHDSLNDRVAKIEESKNVTQTPSKPVEPADQNRSFEEETTEEGSKRKFDDAFSNISSDEEADLGDFDSGVKCEKDGPDLHHRLVNNFDLGLRTASDYEFVKETHKRYPTSQRAFFEHAKT